MRNLTLLVDKHTKLITTHGEYTHFTEDYEEGVIYAITARNYIVGYASNRVSFVSVGSRANVLRWFVRFLWKMKML